MFLQCFDTLLPENIYVCLCMAKNRITNAHDKFVKEMFSDKQMAIAFLEAKLPASLRSIIDLQSLSNENKSFISMELGEIFADIVLKFKVPSIEKELYISILIENKSVPDAYVIFQLQEYISGAYRNQIKMKEKLRPVIPFVYYHGNKEWELKSMKDFFVDYPKEILDYIPDIETIFISLRDMSDDQIGSIDNRMLYTALMMQRYRYDVKRLEENIEQLLISLTAYSDWNFLKTMIVYCLDVTELTESKIIEIADKGDKHIKDVIMSTYDQILEKGREEGIDLGIEKGREEGIEEGIEKAQVDMILKGHENKLDTSILSNISGIAESRVIEILINNGRIK